MTLRDILMMAVCATNLATAQHGSGTKDFAVIGYYAGDGTDLEAHQLDQLTHLIWCFSHVRGDSMVMDDQRSERRARNAVAVKKGFPKLKVLLSLGGWGGCANCSEVFSRESGRHTFALSAKKLLNDLDADGIDLDWEYPAVQGPPGHAFAPEDRGHFTALVRELRVALGPEKEISFAVGGTDACIKRGFEWKEVMPLVDRVHIMSYDLVHGYSTTTGHHTPLFSCAGQVLSADHAVHLLDSLGVPRKKIVIGSAFYARVWRDVPDTSNGLFQSGAFSRTVPHSAIDTVINATHGFEWFRDTIAQAPYAHNRTTHEFVTCDDMISVAAKTRYALDEGLSGIMFWQVRDDALRDGLLEAIHRALMLPSPSSRGSVHPTGPKRSVIR